MKLLSRFFEVRPRIELDERVFDIACKSFSNSFIGEDRSGFYVIDVSPRSDLRPIKDDPSGRLEQVRLPPRILCGEQFVDSLHDDYPGRIATIFYNDRVLALVVEAIDCHSDVGRMLIPIFRQGATKFLPIDRWFEGTCTLASMIEKATASPL